MMMIERKTISIMKACELVGVSRRTIYNWIASGKIEYVRTAGGSVRIFVDTLWREPGRTADFHHQRSFMMPASERLAPGTSVDETSDLGLLFHRLNNQLGIILANAELLEGEARRRREPRARGAGRRQRSRRDDDRPGNSPPQPLAVVASRRLSRDATLFMYFTSYSLKALVAGGLSTDSSTPVRHEIGTTRRRSPIF